VSGTRLSASGALGDHDAITMLIARFDDAVNRRDVAEFGRLWAEDAIWEIGDPFPLRVQARDRIIGTWTGMVANTEWLFRGSFVGVVNIEGETANGRWPCVETGTFKATGSTPAKGYDNRALYEDRYVKQDGIWLFAHRRYLYLWLSSEDLPGDPVPLGEEIAPDPAV
jgi:ketosteroid isomerase-like protein